MRPAPAGIAGRVSSLVPVVSSNPGASLPDGWAAVGFPDRGNGPYRLLRGANIDAVRAFEASVLDPRAAQERALARVLTAVAGTEQARALGLAAVRTVADLRAAAPIRPFEAFADALDRMADGASSVLVADPVRRFVKTSGTTGRPKLLPVTDAWARQVSAAQALWVTAMVQEQEEVIHGKALVGVGPVDEGTTRGGVRYGSNTGRMAAGQPWIVRARYAVPARVHEIEDAEVRSYVALRLALSADVRTWTTANPSSILATCRLFDRWREELTADCADGTLRRGPAAGLAASTRWRLWWATRRARLPDGVRLGERWRLAAINCWKGGAAPYFLDRLPAALGARVPVRDPGVSASEGTFAVPLHSSWWGGAAFADGPFVELVPEGGGDPVLLHEAEAGASYRLVISTVAGLLRYDLNDVVRVEGHLGRLPVLRFLRKGRDVLSVVGEKVTAEQVVEAARGAAAWATGFSVGVRLAEVPVYVLLLEGPGDVALAAAAFERALCALNPEYAGKRATFRLAAAVAERVPDGTFARVRASRLAAGAAEGQVKDPVLAHGDELDRLAGGWL